MSEQKLSVSFRLDDGLLDHNNRKIIAKNVDVNRIPDDIFYRQTDLREFYGQIFDKALAEYNANRRPYLRIKNYYDHIESSKQEKLFEEVIVQFGDRETCGLKSGNWDLAKELLDEYMRGFEKRNPNMLVFNSVLHADEDTPHLHIDFVPVCYNQKRGLSTRVSMKRALAEQGFSAANKMQNEWVAWEKSEMEILTELLRSRGIERDVKHNTEEHLPVDDFKEKQAAVEEKHKLIRTIDRLKRTPAEDFTTEDAALIKNANEILTEKLANLTVQLEAQKRLNKSPFVEYDVYDPDKLQYIVNGLNNSSIPFVEELFSVYVPETALRSVKVFADRYTPTPVTIRDRVKLDIDCLTYAADNFDDLLKRLEERGYEIRRGKYTSVKPPFGQRAVRVENLGGEYSRDSIENRIHRANEAIQATSESYENGSSMQKMFFGLQTRLIIEVSAFRIYPEKRDPDKPYSFVNDPRIECWLRQLETIHEFNLHSREAIQAKMEELQYRIESYSKINVDVSKEQEDLERVRELMKVYKIVVEGNFIDNLIKAEQERKVLEAQAELEHRRKAELAAKQKALQKTEKSAPAPAPEQPKTVQQTTPSPKKKIGHRR